ncbi:S8 family peptidase [Diaminobutyricimonas sp. TR449]|uniref:S8 family peptidase n=1 Tax=Diaminobutyricimonas sp. TR449 TaxID=2708076 RepID=UPI001FBA09EB|nr:S8 family peptidase [Diaminobutyricimonas sp. TR449]
MRARARRTPARTIRHTLTLITGTALLATTMAAVPLAASAAPQSIGGGQSQTHFAPGRYIVTLQDDAAATYTGGVNGFAPTKPREGRQLNAKANPVKEYSGFLAKKQREVAASVGAEIDYSYTLAINGFAADLTAEQAAKLAADKDVAYLTPDELKHITATPSTEFLGLEGADGVWAATGGADSAGAGVVVGVLDTGIAPENPAFAGDSLDTTAGSEPYRSGDTITFAKADGQSFTGICQTGVQFTVDDCNTKVIGARYYVDGFGASSIGGEALGEYLSARDGDGHGSHTASTAAGNIGTAATVAGSDVGTFTGVAPAAKISAYKVCWTGKDPASTSDDGCATSDLLAAINQAVADGVDVINFSIGGGAAQTTYSATDDAFLGAAAAGVFVSASAGNAGPGASTLDNASPWITTVAASTIPSYEGTVTLGSGQAYAGASITVGVSEADPPIEGSLVNSTALAATGTAGAKANLCGPGTLNPALVTPGTIVVCERGEFDRVAKSAEVARVGGIGMVLVNVVPGSIDLDTHSVPTVHLNAQFHDAVIAYANTVGATAVLAAGNSTGVTPPTPQVAGFSSRGPVLADGSDILKPDIAAPGVAILAATANAESAEPTFSFLSGTSMAAPHIAGLAALYFGERPNATPAEVKSAMMTTAYDTVDGAGNAVTDPFAQGAGHVDPTKYFEPGLVYLNGVPDWLAYLQGLGYDAGVDPIDASNLNLASIAVGTLTAPETVTRTVTATQSGTFAASVSGLAGIDVEVSPATLAVTEGESYEFSVTFTRTDAALDEFATGSISWTSGDTIARSPVAVQPVTIVAPANVSGTGIDGSTEITVTPGGSGEIPLSSTGLSKGTTTTGSGISGDLHEYPWTVAEGTVHARFDLDAAADTADLDLVVYQLDAAGIPIAGWQSASGAADERVDLAAPDAGEYLVLVSVYSANPATDYDLTTTNVSPGGSAVALDPAVLTAAQGVPATFTASWSGLEPRSTYLGLIRYGDTGASTVLTVDSGEPPLPVPSNTTAPSISGSAQPGNPVLADPGKWDTKKLQFSYQWQLDGVNIPGATDRFYWVRLADAGHQLSVVVTATKEGMGEASASSKPVTVKPIKRGGWR